MLKYKLLMVLFLPFSLIILTGAVLAPPLSCADIGFAHELKAENGSGVYTLGDWMATLWITDTAVFESNLPVGAAIIKGGQYSNIYRFSPPVLTAGDLEALYGRDIGDVLLCRGVATAVSVADFGTRIDGDNVVIYWESANELTTVLYEVLRNGDVIAKVLPQMPGSVIGATYTVTDTLGCATYSLRATEIGGSVTEFELGVACPSLVRIVKPIALSSIYLSVLLFGVLVVLSNSEQDTCHGKRR